MSKKQHAVGCSFYTYVYGDDLSDTSRRFYETQAMAREDVVAFREKLIGEPGRSGPLPEMKIVRLETLPVNARALVALFNDLEGKLGGFIRSRRVVEVVREPQVKVSQSAR
ncbi:hypothetical protein OIV19_09100 [Brucella sp. HL-2]|nr:hypothetical protein [Brucella sp. HL-2]MCV9907770.1 hypothetical protein [Brucella sp. HL-2]